jgi:hypothetical protein
VRVERLDDEPPERVVADDAGERDVEAECRRAARRDSARTTERSTCWFWVTRSRT